MAQSGIDKIPPGPKLDVLTAEKVFGWKNVHKHEDSLVGKKQDKAGRWRSAKVPYYSTNFLNAYLIEGRMERLGRLDRYLRQLFRITHANNIPSAWASPRATLPCCDQSYGSVRSGDSVEQESQ